MYSNNNKERKKTNGKMPAKADFLRKRSRWFLICKRFKMMEQQYFKRLITAS
jgi:hypothetical protein